MAAARSGVPVELRPVHHPAAARADRRRVRRVAGDRGDRGERVLRRLRAEPAGVGRAVGPVRARRGASGPPCSPAGCRRSSRRSRRTSRCSSSRGRSPGCSSRRSCRRPSPTWRDTIGADRRQHALAVMMAFATSGLARRRSSAGVAAEFLGWRAGFVATSVLSAVRRRAALAAARARARAAASRRCASGSRRSPASGWVRVVLGLAFVEGAVIFGSLTFVAASLQADGVERRARRLGGRRLRDRQRALHAARHARDHAGRLAACSLAGGAGLAAAGLFIAAAESTVLTAVLATLALGAGFGFLHSTLQLWATQVQPAGARGDRRAVRERDLHRRRGGERGGGAARRPRPLQRSIFLLSAARRDAARRRRRDAPRALRRRARTGAEEARPSRSRSPQVRYARVVRIVRPRVVRATMRTRTTCRGRPRRSTVATRRPPRRASGRACRRR